VRQAGGLGSAKEPALQHHGHGEERERFQYRLSQTSERERIEQRRLPMRRAAIAGPVTTLLVAISHRRRDYKIVLDRSS
jgi:hypothetical protein